MSLNMENKEFTLSCCIVAWVLTILCHTSTAVTSYSYDPQEQRLHTDCLVSAIAVLKSAYINAELFFIFLLGILSPNFRNSEYCGPAVGPHMITENVE